MSIIGQVFARLFKVGDGAVHKTPEGLLSILIAEHEVKTGEKLNPKSATDVMKALGIPDSETSFLGRETTAIVYEDEYPKLQDYRGTEEQNSELIKALLDDYVKHHV